MWNILGKIFNPKKLGDSVMSGIDKSILSKEEKIDYMKEMLSLYQPYKLAQRIIAILFVSVFLLVHLMGVLLYCVHLYKGLEIESVMGLFNFNNDSLGYPVLTIIGFYFAGGVFEGIASKIKSKRDKKEIKNN